MTDIMEQQPKASSTRQEREAAFDAHVESNLKRNCPSSEHSAQLAA